MLGRAQEAPKIFACTSCTRRKVRCDKLQPSCSTCVRLRLDCQYQEPQTKKRRRGSDNVRLEHYERLLREHNLLDESPKEVHGQLITDSANHRYVESTLWRTLGHPDELGDEVEEPAFFAHAALGVPQPHRDLRDYHPSNASQLWSIYKDRVDPAVKLLHIPTTEELMAKTSFTKQEECLVFAIYFFAISALSGTECSQMLQQDRSQLIALYRECLNSALLNADFLRTTNVQVMQALVLLLTMTRARTDAQIYWILVGIAIRVAQRMGLHRDGSITGLSPFDTEINRRLFWQLPQLDGFASQFAGIGASVLDSMFWDTKQPLNINDADIWPGMTTPPTEHKGATELIYLLVRSTFTAFYKDFSADLRQLEQTQDEQLYSRSRERVDKLEDMLESQYLRYCDPMEPIQYCVSLMARIAIQASRFRIRMPWAKADKMSADERRQHYTLALQILDRFLVSQTNPMISKFHAHTNSFVVWDILIFCITYIQRVPSEAQLLWSKLGMLYECQAHLLSMNVPIAAAVGKQVLRAWDAQSGSRAPPEYINKLRADLAARTPPEPPVDPMITMDDVENFDWAFWDQLIRDPDSMIVGPL